MGPGPRVHSHGLWFSVVHFPGVKVNDKDVDKDVVGGSQSELVL